ncbi:MAG: hypothetical protein KAJ07_05325, partial [Planctomycetes bacterium]|nr:hypothetical protein [Planctomycetota bacterium]
MTKISDRLKQVQDNISAACDRSGRTPAEITVVVVTKNASIDNIKEVISLGYTELGESRLQHLKQVAEEVDEFLENQQDNPDLPKNIDWHMIGHLQRNKVKAVLNMLSIIHSLDTLRLAEEINAAAG